VTKGLYTCRKCGLEHGHASVVTRPCSRGTHDWNIIDRPPTRDGGTATRRVARKAPLKQHYRDASTPLTDSGVPTLCGVIVHVKYTTGRDSVTCRLCQQVLATGTHDFMETK